MNTQEIIEAIMKSTGKSKAELGRAVGIKDVGKNGEERPGRTTDLISKRIKQKNISVNVLIEMLDAMGYTLAVVPKGRNMKDNEYEVTVTAD